MNIRTTLSALAIASLSAFAVQAQTITVPAEQPGTTPAEQPSTSTMPTSPAMQPTEGQRSTPMQDRGAAAGMASGQEAADMEQQARYAAQAARWEQMTKAQGEMSVPNQDRGGYYGLGDPNGALRYQHDQLVK